jgi:predicted extracellular nuclease
MIKTEAEVFALQEIENNGFGDASAIATLVDALNAEALAQGTGAVYAYVNPLGADGFLGSDAIMTGMVYDTTKLTLVHADSLVFEEASAADTYAIAEYLNGFVSSGDQVGDFQRNRPATIATFQDENGEVFTVASNHFKSKGDSNLQDLADAVQSALNAGSIPADDVAEVEAALTALRADPNFDQGNGQGFWNQVRTDASTELTAWLESTYASDLSDLGVTDADYLLMGDFNAYAEEDPVQSVRDGAGYTDLIDQFIGQEDAYSFVFDGQQGTLDQALASDSMTDQVTGLTEWHINADEPDLFNYRDGDFYSDDPFAASDHDPVIVGLDLGSQPDAMFS